MKLVFCPECHDVFKLQYDHKQCMCGKSGGKYTDEINAIIEGMAIPLGFSNGSFVKALKQYPFEAKMGERFEAFIIPENAPTVKRIKD